ncbi:pentapeptide repeat-containing protein [Nodosilinea sp. LEGE 07088]|uniref:pentapeptide repeat-containing protein n=1 Tax=Nodosilinea sp. LEGE 07088 TaxID=2777968 RepID=UPI001881915A|nr:pentapeptide repeat-containing protein [Nodosilinea sp. LEGE 07088]MBE9141320.1 pentapeptide repeat-containing protein [Nodosilinea sp. LEGE 07088]
MGRPIKHIKWLASPHPSKWEPVGRKIAIMLIKYILHSSSTPQIPVHLQLIRIYRNLSSRILTLLLVAILVIAVSIWLADLKQYSVADVLKTAFGNAESIAIVTAAIIFLLEIRTRRKKEHYEAWQVITSAQGQTGNGGRVQALEDLNRDGVSLQGTDVSKSDLHGIRLRWSKLDRANFEETILASSDFRDSFLCEVNFRNSVIFGSDLRNANLSSANLENVDLSFASLKKTILCSANLKNANLWGVNLKDANLFAANLEDADLRDTNLEGAHLENANLKNAKFGRHPNFGIETVQVPGLGRFKMAECSLRGITWNENTVWDGVEGLDKVEFVPPELIKQLEANKDN